MKLSEAAIGQQVMMVERMGDEVRHTWYVRRAAHCCDRPLLPHHVYAYRLRTVQGTTGDRPRYDTDFHQSRTQVDGRIVVEEASGWPMASMAQTHEMRRGFRNSADDFGL